MIQVTKLSVRAGGFALKGLSFRAENGKVLGILAPDGSGKTTLMDALAGVSEVEPGQVLVSDADIALHPASAKERLGYMPQKLPLYGDMTIRSYLKFVCDARGLSHRESSEAIGQALKRSALEEVADRRLDALSDGLRRRACLAQAMLGEPENLLIDEPTDALDPKDVALVRAQIRALREEKRCVLLTGRNLTEIRALCDEVIVMKDGAFLAKGTPDALDRMQMLTGGVEACVRGEAKALEAALSSLKGTCTVREAAKGEARIAFTPDASRDAREEVFSAICAAKLTLLELTPEHRGMDDVLVTLESDAFAEEASDDEGRV